MTPFELAGLAVAAVLMVEPRTIAATNDPSSTSYDVIVVGATPGGIAAAIAAHRTLLQLPPAPPSNSAAPSLANPSQPSAPRVALVEPSAWVGGMATGGLGCTDAVGEGSYGGIAREFVNMTNQHYSGGHRQPLPHCRTSTAFEPHVATAVFQQMLAEANVTVYLRSSVARVDHNGTRLVAIQLAESGTVSGGGDGAPREPSGPTMLTATVFIDATYEGDLLAMSGVDFVVGREAAAQYGEPLAGRRPLVPGHCYGFKVAVDPFAPGGSSARRSSAGGSGVRDDAAANPRLLPMVWGGTVAGVGDGDSRVMSYNYRLCLTNATAAAGASRVELTRPSDYDPAYFELLRRYMKAGGHVVTQA
jgi:hypothetical protein